LRRRTLRVGTLKTSPSLNVLDNAVPNHNGVSALLLPVL
jgi:hypothetical protein